MQRVALVTDSSACLLQESLERYGIRVVSLGLAFKGEVLRDGSLAPAQFFRRLREARRPPTTTAPAPSDFLAAFRDAQAAGAEQVLCLTLAANFSSTFGAAVAAQGLADGEVPGLDVRVADTGGLAMTHGFAVLAAARAIEAGRGIEEAAAAALCTARRAGLVGLLDTTLYLARGGRVPWALHWASALLHLRPLLGFENGQARGVGRARTQRGGVERMLRYVQQHASAGAPLHVAVMHADAAERAQELAAAVRERLQPCELLITEFTSVMAVHTGPGFLGLAFCSDE